MKKLLLVLLLSFSSLSAKATTRVSFDSWLQTQRSLLQNPQKFICTYACVQQYNTCYYYSKFDKSKRTYSSKSNSCSSLYLECTTMCSQLPSPSDNGGGGSDGGSTGGGTGSGGGQAPDGSTTPPDTDPSDDETNNPGDGSVPVL